MAKKTRFNPAAFAMTSLAAPAISVVVFLVGMVIAELVQNGASVGLPPVGGFILTLVMIALWGWIPSAVFGGAVLGLVLSCVPAPSWRMLGPAGMLAAALYVLAGLGTFAVRPGLSDLFAPWASGGPNLHDPFFWTIPGSIVLAGGLAGLIYARFAKRG